MACHSLLFRTEITIKNLMDLSKYCKRKNKAATGGKPQGCLIKPELWGRSHHKRLLRGDQKGEWELAGEGRQSNKRPRDKRILASIHPPAPEGRGMPVSEDMATGPRGARPGPNPRLGKRTGAGARRKGGAAHRGTLRNGDLVTAHVLGGLLGHCKNLGL